MGIRDAHPPGCFLRKNTADKWAYRIAQADYSSDNPLVLTPITKVNTAQNLRLMIIPLSESNDIRNNNLHHADDSSSPSSGDPSTYDHLRDIL